MVSEDTKGRILDAARAEFSKRGFEGASIRRITQRAGVQLGATRYHFGSKEDLFRAVFARHMREFQEDRTKYLREDSLTTIEDAVRAYIEPLLSVQFETQGGWEFARLTARTVSDAGERSTRITQKIFDPAAREIVESFRKALPELREPELYWSVFLATGALAMCSSNGARVDRLSEGICNSSDHREVIENLTRFIVGGVLALARRSNE